MEQLPEPPAGREPPGKSFASCGKFRDCPGKGSSVREALLNCPENKQRSKDFACAWRVLLSVERA
jgi:hypothetical protein